MFDKIKSFLRRAEVEQVSEPEEDNFALLRLELEKVSRQLRRLSLNAETQGERLNGIECALEEIAVAQSNAQVDNVSLEQDLEPQWITALDKLARVRSRRELLNGVVWELFVELEQDLVLLSGLQPVAVLGESYHPLHCRVAEALPAVDCSEGTVLQILRQGYRRGDGSCAREAVVVVSSRPEVSSVGCDIAAPGNEKVQSGNKEEYEQFE